MNAIVLSAGVLLAAPLGPVPVGLPPGPGFDWRHLPVVGWGWVGPAPAPAAVPAPGPVVFVTGLSNRAERPRPVFSPVTNLCPDGKCPLAR